MLHVSFSLWRKALVIFQSVCLVKHIEFLRKHELLEYLVVSFYVPFKHKRKLPLVLFANPLLLNWLRFLRHWLRFHLNNVYLRYIVHNQRRFWSHG